MKDFLSIVVACAVGFYIRFLFALRHDYLRWQQRIEGSRRRIFNAPLFRVEASDFVGNSAGAEPPNVHKNF